MQMQPKNHILVEIFTYNARTEGWHQKFHEMQSTYAIL